MENKCLLIKTKDQRQFLTHEKNLPSLIEFAKTFNAEIYLVIPEKKQKALELKTLIAALCNPEYKEEPQYKNLERLLPKPKKDRKTLLAEAAKIRKFIARKLLSGKPLSLQSLKEKYPGSTGTCLCNHMAVVRKQLNKKGYEFTRIATSTYCLIVKDPT